jgi:Protein of unknown function (DUF3306)
MSDEQFLARWSRRKQEAKAGHAEPAPEVAADGSFDHAPAEPVPPESDLSNLPPIESIDAATDVTAFLRNGIPQELSRAAFRRAWSADPAIRDFVGLAENAWDFNDPNAMAGFGPLNYSAEQVEALVSRIIGGVAETAESLTSALAEAAEHGAQLPEAGPAQSSNPLKAIADPQEFSSSAAAESSSNSAASQPVAASGTSEETSHPRRTHGAALPR